MVVVEVVLLRVGPTKPLGVDTDAVPPAAGLTLDRLGADDVHVLIPELGSGISGESDTDELVELVCVPGTEFCVSAGVGAPAVLAAMKGRGVAYTVPSGPYMSRAASR